MDSELIIKWVDGKPVPTHTKILDKEAVSQLPITALSLPYERSELEKELGVDEEFEGMSNIEVALIRLSRDASRGGYKALETLLDRAIGKPKQQIESKNFSMTYEDWLKEKARELENAEEA